MWLNLCGRMHLRVGLTATLTFLLVLGVGIFFIMFHRAPVEDILKQNKAHGIPRSVMDSYDDIDSMDEATLSRTKWAVWVELMNYVSIGEIYNKCEGKDRVTLGTVVMLPDTKLGGVTTRTYFNSSTAYEINDGEAYIEVFYNNKELYKNHWPLCEAEYGMDERVIYCPILKGKLRYIKNMKIPNYLPKGRYTVRGWMTDHKDNMIGCGFCDFTL